MTRNREPMQPEANDWVVIRIAPSGGKLNVLDGPYAYGMLLERRGAGWRYVNPVSGYHNFVADEDIVRVMLSRGEAEALSNRLAVTQQVYITERDALKPKFEQRIRDLLNT